MEKCGMEKVFIEKLKEVLQEMMGEDKAASFVERFFADEPRTKVYELFADLSTGQTECLQMRYGIKDGVCRSMEEIARYYNVTRERIRQIEAKAWRKLWHAVYEIQTTYEQ
jgi:DNA-directed RNA polymerase sigma subunit (sigma70/sigma32)